MATHADIGLSQPAASTITMKIASVTLTRNSTVQHQELLTLADELTTNALARVTDAAPGSTMFGLVVRVADPSTGPFSISTGSMRVHQSTASDLNVTVSGYSTIVSVSTGSMRVHQSTASDLLMTARVNTSSGGAVEGSTARAAGGLLGLHVRQVYPTIQVTTQSTVGQSTATVLLSSAATVPHVSAFALVSTAAGPIVGGFFAGSTLVWPTLLWADGGIAQVQLAVAPPGYLFKGVADRPLEFHITSGSTGTIYCAITNWQE
jgi:hypothetical protein